MDLALEGDSALDYSTVMALEMAFEKSILPYKVDIIDLNQAGDGFRQIVDAQKVLLPLTNTPSQNKNWRTVRLGDLINIIRGRSYRSDQLQDNLNTALVTLKSFSRSGGYREDGLKPYIGPYDEEQVIYPNDIVVAQTDITQNGDIIGRPAIIPNNVTHLTLVASLDVAIIRHKPKNNLDPTFLYYRLLADDYIHHTKLHSTGTTVLHMHRDGINEFKFSLPSLDEQRSIAHILRTLDEKIDLNRQMNQTLEEMARALFKSWFVDFDPVRAKMDGRWQRGKSLPGLPAEYYDIFPDRLVDSELGSIPEGWDIKPLVVDFRNELALQNHKPVNNEPQLPVVKITQLKNGQGKGWAKGNITPECIDDGDVIISWSGSLVVKVWCGGRAALNQHLFKVTSIEYPKWFFLFWLEEYLKKNQDIAADKATTMEHIRRHYLRVKCIIPNKRFFSIFNNMFESLFTKQVLNNIQSRSLVNLRDTLLSKLISGKIIIPEGLQK